MPSAKYPINVNLESTDGDVDRAKIVNGYAEVAGAQEVKVYSRPAMNLAQGSFAAFGQGLANTPDGKLFVVSGGDIYFPVPGQTVGSALSTTTNNEEVTGLPAVLNGNIFFIPQGSGAGGVSGIVRRSVSPYSTWSVVGTISTNTRYFSDLISYAGKLWAMGGVGVPVVHTSADGATWGTLSNSPTLANNGQRAMAAFENTLYVFPVPTLGTASAFSYTSDQGATVWSTAPINYSGSAIPSVRYRGASDRIWALGGTGRVAYTVDGTGWVNVTDTAGPSAPGSFEALNGILYVANSGTNVQASSDGLTWASVGTSTLSLNSIFSAKGELYGFSSTPPNFVLFGLSGDGTLQSISPVGSIGSPSGEVVSLISTEAGVSFLKTTAEAYTISAAGLFTRVTDAQYPAVTVRGAVYLNGHLYVMEPDGTIWNSAEDDFTSWASTDFVTAEFEADGGVCLAKHGEYVIALGQFTTEAFYHAADRATASPLDPVGSSVMLIGCAHANSVAQVEQSLAWVAQQKGQGSTFHKGRFVVMMKGYGSYERISTPDVERVLDADAFAEVYADILTIAGHVFYVLTLVDSDITLAYDFRSQLWYEWSLQTAQSGQAITSITAASQLATALLASHGYSDGDQVVVTGGTGTFTAANGTYNVNVVNSGTFTYPITGAFTGTCTTGTGQGWTSGALDISASCYFDNQQLVQLRETGDVYVLDITGTSDNGAPIDFRIRTRNWDGGTNREKFQGSLDVVGDKVSSTGLIRYSDDDFQTYTRFKRVDLSLRRPRTTRGGSFSRRAVEFRHTLSAKVGISALEADIEMGEQ